MEKEIYVTLLLVVFASLVTLCYVYVLFHKVSKIKIDNEKVDEIHKHIHDGAMTFLVS